MTLDQGLLAAITLAALAGFVLQPVRYDVVALLLLLALTLCGFVRPEEAFSGFAEPAVITVAAVLALSRGLQASGAVDRLLRAIGTMRGRETLQVGVQTGLCAAISAFMNNVGALALLMPVALRNAHRDGYPTSRALMPLAFGSVLGGLVTLIGTPPNLVVSAIRAERTDLGGYALFDFAPVGLPVAVAGVAFLLLTRRWLLPDARGAAAAGADPGTYVAEARVPLPSSEGDGGGEARVAGLTLRALESMGDGDVVVVGLFRGGARTLAPSGDERLRPGDALLLEGTPDSIRSLVDEADLVLDEGDRAGAEAMASEEVGVVEAVVRPGSSLVGRSPAELGLRSAHGMNVLGVSRGGRRVAQRMAALQIRTGDVLLLQVRRDRMAEAFGALGLLPLAERVVVLGRRRTAWFAAGSFALALAAVLFEWAPAHVAFPAALVAMILTRVLKPDEAYGAVDWPVVVLLGALFPLGAAMERTGTVALAVEALSGPAAALPAWGLVAAIVLACMLISEVLANNATVLLMAPIALGLAERGGLPPDMALMAVAVGTSCTFLSPIGHQSNTLVMEPGGYRFADYPRLGAPLALVCLVVGTAMVVLVWGPGGG